MLSARGDAFCIAFGVGGGRRLGSGGDGDGGEGRRVVVASFVLPPPPPGPLPRPTTRATAGWRRHRSLPDDCTIRRLEGTTTTPSMILRRRCRASRDVGDDVDEDDHDREDEEERRMGMEGAFVSLEALAPDDWEEGPRGADGGSPPSELLLGYGSRTDDLLLLQKL
jgi:hypothetical protein